jgi:glycine dehydrogenase subunit 1
VAEAATMAVAATRRSELLVSAAVAPRVRELLETYSQGLDIKLVEVGRPGRPHRPGRGAGKASDQTAGRPARPAQLLRGGRGRGRRGRAGPRGRGRMLVTFDPLTAGVLEPPGRLGGRHRGRGGPGARQPPELRRPGVRVPGLPAEDVRRLPGRLVGETLDTAGRRAFVSPSRPASSTSAARRRPATSAPTRP